VDRALRFLGRSIPVAGFSIWLAACGTFGVQNEPINRPISGSAAAAFAASRSAPKPTSDVLTGLAFSGGGTRAAAFSYGVLKEVESTRIKSRRGPGSLLDHVDFVAGVSGGSVLTAYYGLKKRAALDDFRERFLLRDAEESISTELTPVALVKALGGGVNDSAQFARWLNKNLYENATFNDFRRIPGPSVWINAADIYNRTTFVFGEAAFIALCSDLASYPVANAVAASAAVPVVFAPVVIKNYPKECSDQMPEWVDRVRNNANAPPMLKSFADALSRYHNGSMNYVKLFDGGLVDNFGLAPFTIARLTSNTPYGPFSPQQAVNLRRYLYIIVDAGRGPSGDWVKTVDGPRGMELIKAAADTATEASVSASFTAFERTVSDWQGQLIRWRCGLSEDQRKQYGAPPNWNCRDLKFYVIRLAFDQLGPERAAVLHAVDTRFKLPADQVDILISAGRDALRINPIFREFVAGAGGRMPPLPTPPARPAPHVADASAAAR
jgi:NTE family protein